MLRLSLPCWSGVITIKVAGAKPAVLVAVAVCPAQWVHLLTIVAYRDRAAGRVPSPHFVRLAARLNSNHERVTHLQA